MRNAKVKKSTRKVSKVPFDPATLIDIPRDPGGRAPLRREAAEFEPPVPMTVVNLRGIVKPSERIKQSEAKRASQSKDDKATRLSDWL